MRYVIGTLIIVLSLIETACSSGGSSSSPSTAAGLTQSFDAQRQSYKLDYSYSPPVDSTQIDFVEIREADMSVYVLDEVSTCTAGIPVKRWNGPFFKDQSLTGFYLSGRESKFRYALCVWNKDGSVQARVDELYVAPASAKPSQSVSAAAALPTYTATKITSGEHFTCALFSNGRIKCWGKNLNGQLGLGDTNDRGDAAGEMGTALPYVDLGTDSRGKALLAVDVSAGLSHVCAVLNDGRVKCWGRNQAGQLGLGDILTRGDAAGEMGNALPYVDLGSGLTAKSISLGGFFSCALLNTNLVKCWGVNDIGQLGRGNTTNVGMSAGQMGNNLATVNLGSGRTVKDISAGLEHACAILDNNAVKCWGSNEVGQLGLGDSDNRGEAAGQMGDALPYVDLGTTLFFFATYANEISGGSSHTCVTTWIYQLKCWGDNYAGQLGIGTSVASLGDSPNQMGNFLDRVDFGAYIMSLSQPIARMQVGFGTTCTQLYTSEVKCWGLNNLGQLGIASTQTYVGRQQNDMGAGLPSVNIGDGNVLKMFSSQYGTTCVITQDSLIKCWGVNTNGELGYGDKVSRGALSTQMGSNLPYVSL